MSPADMGPRDHQSTQASPQQHSASADMDDDEPVVAAPAESETDKEFRILSNLLSHVEGDVVRKVIREYANICLLGNPQHSSFVLRKVVESGAIRDVEASVKQIILASFSTEDLDHAADQLLPRLSPAVQDRILMHRIATIPGPRLMNALGRSGRLGYTEADLQPDADEMYGVVLTSTPSIGNAAGPATSTSSSGVFDTASASASATPSSPVSTQCPLCKWVLEDEEALKAHINKSVCQTRWDSSRIKAWCKRCGQRFTTKIGLTYHSSSRVCGPSSIPPANLPPASSSSATASTPVRPPPRAEIVTPKMQPPHFSTPQQQQQQSQQHDEQQQQQPPSSAKKSPVFAPVAAKDDPYGSLTPELRTRLDKELRDAEIHFEQRRLQIDRHATDEERATQMASLKNCLASKQSTIRRKYKVSLRVRRTKAEIKADHDAAATAATAHTAAMESPIPSSRATFAKRAAANAGAQSLPSPSSPHTASGSFPPAPTMDPAASQPSSTASTPTTSFTTVQQQAARGGQTTSQAMDTTSVPLVQVSAR